MFMNKKPLLKKSTKKINQENNGLAITNMYRSLNAKKIQLGQDICCFQLNKVVNNFCPILLKLGEGDWLNTSPRGLHQ